MGNNYIYVQVGNGQFVHCRQAVHYSECPLSEVPLYVCDWHTSIVF